jgi:hypothetical protein
VIKKKTRTLTHYNSINQSSLSSHAIMVVSNLLNTIVTLGLDRSRNSRDVAFDLSFSVHHAIV